jgi:hypothetical protein
MRDKYTVDECPDANGFSTIRLADGSVNGDVDAAPVATVYDDTVAQLIVRLLNAIDP